MSHLWQPIFNSLKSSRIVLTAAHCFKKFDFETSEISDTIDISQGQGPPDGSEWTGSANRWAKLSECPVNLEKGIYLYAGFNNRTQLKQWTGTLSNITILNGKSLPINDRVTKLSFRSYICDCEFTVCHTCNPSL